MKNRNKKGFTIVELVIVIGVIGILSAILIPTFANLTNEANKARAVAEVQSAYSLYIQDAVDGHVGGETGPALEQLGQDKVAIFRVDTWYTYSSSGWVVDNSLNEPTKAAGSKLGNDYNNCEVHKILPNS